MTARGAALVIAGGVAVMLALIVAAALRGANPDAPAAQLAFVGIYDRFADEYRLTTNELAREPIRGRRAAMLCAAGGPPEARQWIGRVERVGIDAIYDRVAIRLRLSDRVTAQTHTPISGNPESTTSLSRDHPLIGAVTALRQGDRVLFDATFLPDPRDCIAEISLSEAGGMRAPELLFRLTAIAPMAGR